MPVVHASKLQRAFGKYAAEELQRISLLKTQKEVDMADYRERGRKNCHAYTL